MNDATYECVESVIANFKNCYLKESILLITPRDIKESVDDEAVLVSGVEKIQILRKQ